MATSQLKNSPRKHRFVSKTRRIAPLLFAVAFGMLGGYLLLTTHAATTLQPSVVWTYTSGKLVNKNSNLCLGTLGNSQPATGVTVVIEGCNTINSEKWSLTWTSTVKNTTIVNGYGQCLDDRGGNAGVGSTVKIYTCITNDTAQSWATGYGDGTIRIDGLCLGVSGNSKSAGTDVILTPCATPVPSTHFTSPAVGSTASNTATVSASTSISQDTIAKITLQVGSTVLYTCMNASSCSASWNTTTVNNGSYTLTAIATGALGGTATATETVHVSNAALPPPSGSGTGNSGGGSGGGTSAAGDSGSSVISDSTTDGGTYTCDPTDPTCSDSTITTCDPTDPTCSNATLCDPSDPTCANSSSTDTTNSTGSNAPSTSGGSPSSHHSSTASSAKLEASKTSVKEVLGATFSLLALIIIGCVLFIGYRKRAQVNNQPVYDSNEFFNQIVPPTPAPAPTSTTPIQQDPVTQDSVAGASLPSESSAATEARLHWWGPNAGQQQAQSTNVKRDDELPDMFEEGRKRLDQESEDGRLKF